MPDIKSMAVLAEELAALQRLPRTRPEARAVGSLLYFPALRCRRGHTAARRVSDGRCLACVEAAREAKAAAVKSAADKLRAKRDARKVAAQRAKVAAEAKAKDAKKAAQRAERDARAKQRAKEKAAVTRAANKVAKAAETEAARAAEAVRPAAIEGQRAGDSPAPWE